MDAMYYRMEASLYYAKDGKSRQRSLVFKRFSRASEAIRFAVEELAPKVFESCSLEVNDAHFFGREIRPLYESGDFPLQRRQKK